MTHALATTVVIPGLGSNTANYNDVAKGVAEIVGELLAANAQAESGGIHHPVVSKQVTNDQLTITVTES